MNGTSVWDGEIGEESDHVIWDGENMHVGNYVAVLSGENHSGKSNIQRILIVVAE